MFAGHYVRFLSDLDICNDGSRPDHNDPSYQSQTAFYNGGKFLNADKDKMAENVFSNLRKLLGRRGNYFYSPVTWQNAVGCGTASAARISARIVIRFLMKSS